MSVNERVYASGLIKAFYKAVDEKKVREVRAILVKIGLTETSIIPILEQLGFET